MRRVCRSLLQTRCPHAKQPYSPGQAVFAALQGRSFATSLHRHQKRPAIRYYEQTGKNKSSIRPLDDEGLRDDFEDLEVEGEEWEALQKELEELEGGGLDLTAPASEEAGAVQLRKPSSMDEFENEPLDLHSLEMQFKLPRMLSIRIDEFNKVIKQAAVSPGNLQIRRKLWLSYSRCSSSVPGFLDQISGDAWKVLWRSQSTEPFFSDQAGHLVILAEDMYKCGKSLSPHQKLTRIKAMEATGMTAKAVDLWYTDRKELQHDPNLRHEYIALGVTLECNLGRPARAQELAFQAIGDRARDMGAVRLFIPVIGALAKDGVEESLKMAWTLYLYIRRSLSQTKRKDIAMTLEDYDQIVLAFFDAGRKDMALMVFKDLVLAGCDSDFDSLRHFSSFNSALDHLQSRDTTAEVINTFSLEALKLPRSFENKYFYASWMKRLIGMGRVDAAAVVMELMYERGIRPDPKHINGIIGAWLREGTQQDQETALSLGWAMVHERLRLVAKRRYPQSNNIEVQHDALSGIRIPKHLQRHVPPAQIETLCLLLLYYGKKNMISYVDRIKDLLSAAELSPNSYFMNHLMYSYVNQAKVTQAWHLYVSMSRNVKPDMATFTCLWDGAQKLVTKYEQTDRFPGPRRLFSTMMDWWSQLGPKDRAAAQEDFGAELYTQIIRVFCTWKDIKGTLVALYAMRDNFGLYPGDQIIRLVTGQIAQLGDSRQAPHPHGRSRARRRQGATSDLPKNLERANRVLEMLLRNRASEVESQGTKMEDLHDEQRAEETLWVVAELLRAAERRLVAAMADNGQDLALSEEVDKVAFEMGAGPFKMGPPMYSK